MITRFDAAVITEKKRKLKLEKFKSAHSGVIESVMTQIVNAAEAGEYSTSVGFTITTSQMDLLIEILKEAGFDAWVDGEKVITPKDQRNEVYIQGLLLGISWKGNA